MFQFVNDLLDFLHRCSGHEEMSQDEYSPLLKEMEDKPTEIRELFFTVPGHPTTFHIELLIWRNGSELEETRLIIRKVGEDKIIFTSEDYGTNFHMTIGYNLPDGRTIPFVIACKDPRDKKSNIDEKGV